MREMLAFLAYYDATVGLFWANAIFRGFGPVFGSKMADFGPKMAFFTIFGFYLMPASASLCKRADILTLKTTSTGETYVKFSAF